MQKNALILSILLTLISIPAYILPAKADHHLVFISSVVKLSDTSCAFGLEISGSNQDEFTATDQIILGNGSDNTTVTTFADFMSTINASGGNNDNGDSILTASTTFETEVGITADMSFDDSLCQQLTATTIVDFDINGSTNIDRVDLGTLETFGVNTAVVKASTSSDPELLDLTAGVLTVTKNDGTTAEVQAEASVADDSETDTSTETTTSGSSGSGSCHLSNATTGVSSLWFTIVIGLIPLFLLRWVVRKHLHCPSRIMAVCL